jgi:hypothetical protein
LKDYTIFHTTFNEVPNRHSARKYQALGYSICGDREAAAQVCGCILGKMVLSPQPPQPSPFVNPALAESVVINNISAVRLLTSEKYKIAPRAIILGISLPSYKPRPLNSRANEEPAAGDVFREFVEQMPCLRCSFHTITQLSRI